MDNRRDRSLLALLAAEVISTTGTEITAIALPWFVLVTTGSPARMGTVLASGFLGMTVLGIPSGRLATRLGPRQTMLFADGFCAAAIAAIPLLYWAGALSFPAIIVLAFGVGAFFPAYNASQSLLLTSLVDDDERGLIRAGGLLGAFNETASFIGPAIGGALVALLGAAPVLLLDACSYVVALALVATFVPPAPAAHAPTDRSIRAGLRHIRRNTTLTRTIAGLALVELSFTALVATLPVVTRVRYEGGAALAGWLLASYGAGSVAGGLLSARARSVNDRTATLAIAALAVSTWPLVAQLPSYGVALAVAANGVCSGLYFPRFFASVTLRTPEPLRARVNAAVTTAISATGPIGFAAAGLLLQQVSLTATYAVIALSATMGAAVVAAVSMLSRAHVEAIDITDPAIAAELLELQRAAYRTEAELIGSDEIPPLRESLNELRGCGETFLAAFVGGNVVGAVSWKIDEETIDIHRLVVDPAHFRRGIGTTLIRAVLGANPDAARAIVQTGEANKPAAALYLREGFALVGTVEPIAGLRVTQFAKVLRSPRQRRAADAKSRLGQSSL